MALLCVLAVLVLSAQQAAGAAGQIAQPGLSGSSRPLTCACTRELRPVCGSDGRVYDNSCLACCAGVQFTDPKPGNSRNCNNIAILPPGLAGQNSAGNGNTPGSSNAISSGGSRAGRHGRAYNTKCEAECVGVTITGQRPVNGVCNSGPIGPINPSGPGFNPSGPIGTRPWWQGQPWPNPMPESGPGTGPLPGPGVGPGPGLPRPGVGPGPRPGCACASLLSPVCGVDGKTYSNSCVARCNGVAIAAQGNCSGGG